MAQWVRFPGGENLFKNPDDADDSPVFYRQRVPWHNAQCDKPMWSEFNQ